MVYLATISDDATPIPKHNLIAPKSSSADEISFPIVMRLLALLEFDSRVDDDGGASTPSAVASTTERRLVMIWKALIWAILMTFLVSRAKADAYRLASTDMQGTGDTTSGMLTRQIF